MKNFWKIIKEVINIRSRNMFSFTSLMINSTVTTNERQIAEHFNKCFTSIAGKFN